MTENRPCEAVAAEMSSWGREDGRITPGKILGHFCTITEHKFLVFQGCRIFPRGIYQRLPVLSGRKAQSQQWGTGSEGILGSLDAP